MVCDLCDRLACSGQSLASLSETIACHVFQRRHMEIFLKQSIADPLTDVRCPSEVLHGDRLRVVDVDIELHRFQIFIANRLFVLLRYSRASQIEDAQPYIRELLAQREFVSPAIFVQLKGGADHLQEFCLCGSVR